MTYLCEVADWMFCYAQASKKLQEPKNSIGEKKCLQACEYIFA